MPLSSAERGPRGRRDVRRPLPVDAPAGGDIRDASTSSLAERPAKRRRRTASPDRNRNSYSNSNGNGNGNGNGAAKHANDFEAASRQVLDGDQLVAQVTQYLKSHPVQASQEHANAIHEANGDGVKAYAKVAAQDWTYYVTDLVVNIGRRLEATGSQPGGGSHNTGSGPGGDANTGTNIMTRNTTTSRGQVVHIDIGPSKMVSREHASISFDSRDETWVLHVKGRNGARMNGQPLRPGATHPLTSGEVIEIGNVEMIFVLPSELGPLHIHPMFLRRSGLSAGSPPAGHHAHSASSSSALPAVSAASASASAPQPQSQSHQQQQRDIPGTPSSAGRRDVPAASLRSPLPTGTPANSASKMTMASSGVDLSRDENHHVKPQYSYAQMITQAILNAPDGKLNLNGIYTFIMNTYSYYRHQQAAGWQNSIRHNLSLNKSFDKVARSTDEPGKGMKWQIVPESREEMTRNAFKIGRGGHRGSSAPSSPSQLNYITHGPKDMAAVKESPSARKRRGRASPPASPPSRSRPAIRAANLTPDRKPLRQDRPPADGSPLRRSRKSAAADDPSVSAYQPQSPTLTSSYLQDDGASFVTPAQPRVHPRLAPPSTAQRPSQHMLTSSPAPFWKYADIGSTPLKPLAPYESPSKQAGALPTIQSSSPSSVGKSPLSSPSRPQRSSQQEPTERAYEADDDDVDDDEEVDEAQASEGFDLMKGFQSIGSYHAPVGRGIPVPPAFVKGKS